MSTHGGNISVDGCQMLAHMAAASSALGLMGFPLSIFMEASSFASTAGLAKTESTDYLKLRKVSK